MAIFAFVLGEKEDSPLVLAYHLVELVLAAYQSSCAFIGHLVPLADAAISRSKINSRCISPDICLEIIIMI